MWLEHFYRSCNCTHKNYLICISDILKLSSILVDKYSVCILQNLARRHHKKKSAVDEHDQNSVFLLYWTQKNKVSGHCLRYCKVWIHFLLYCTVVIHCLGYCKVGIHLLEYCMVGIQCLGYYKVGIHCLGSVR